jgi:geranylgeranyl diphosphate synthase, type II
LEFRQFYQNYIPGFRKRYSGLIRAKAPHFLYDPLSYVLQYSGKQLRPAILAASAAAFSDSAADDAFPAAACIEMIHNFTLIHDDIMDNDMMRHGVKTLHAKWDRNRAILAGDGLFAIALAELDHYRNRPELYSKILPMILDAVIRVCEGQALDMEFEYREDVSTDDYLDMVRKKTAWLLAVSAKTGAVIGDADPGSTEQVESILLDTGILFQIQDDLLELTSNAETMGKTLGSDLVRGKKTYPYLFARQIMSPAQWEDFLELCSGKTIDQYGIEPARKHLERYFIFDKIGEVITLYHDRIQERILHLPAETQELYQSMLSFIMHRDK